MFGLIRNFSPVARLPYTAKRLRRDLFWASEARYPQRRNIQSFISRVEKVSRMIGTITNVAG